MPVQHDLAARPTAADRGGWLAGLLGALAPDVFFARDWERRAVHVPVDADRGLFAIRDLDELLARMAPDASVKLARATEDGSHSRPARAGAQALTDLYRSYDAGDTIIVDGMHELWPAIGRLCRGLTGELGMEVHANLYVTPRAAAGFPCHWDGHDVLILQLEGSKTWSVYARDGDLPSPRSDGGAYTAGGEPELAVTLRPGHVLYIPRGAPHQAWTGDDPSAHLTVGLYPATWEELLIAGVQHLAASVPELRRSLPLDWLLGVAPPDGPTWQALVGRLADPDHADRGLQALAAEVAERAPCLADGHFSGLGDLDRIGVDARVRRQPGALLRASWHDDEATLAFPGSHVSGPGKLLWAFEFIAQTESFTVGDIPGWYSDAERVTLVRLLVRAGCLRLANGTSSPPAA